MQVEEDGKSECLPVMGRIGDETIALTRKRADFHLVTLRKKGQGNCMNAIVVDCSK